MRADKKIIPKVLLFLLLFFILINLVLFLLFPLYHNHKLRKFSDSIENIPVPEGFSKVGMTMNIGSLYGSMHHTVYEVMLVLEGDPSCADKDVWYAYRGAKDLFVPFSDIPFLMRFAYEDFILNAPYVGVWCEVYKWENGKWFWVTNTTIEFGPHLNNPDAAGYVFSSVRYSDYAPEKMDGREPLYYIVMSNEGPRCRYDLRTF